MKNPHHRYRDCSPRDRLRAVSLLNKSTLLISGEDRLDGVIEDLRSEDGVDVGWVLYLIGEALNNLGLEVEVFPGNSDTPATLTTKMS